MTPCLERPTPPGEAFGQPVVERCGSRPGRRRGPTEDRIWPEQGEENALTSIELLRQRIQQRLNDVVEEADRLRRALAALDAARSVDGAESKRSSGRSRRPGAGRAVTQAASARSQKQRGAKRGAATRSSTRERVLAALADGKAMTAGDVAAVSGLKRPTVSTTLSRLVKNGDVVRAERGYQVHHERGRASA